MTPSRHRFRLFAPRRSVLYRLQPDADLWVSTIGRDSGWRPPRSLTTAQRSRTRAVAASDAIVSGGSTHPEQDFASRTASTPLRFRSKLADMVWWSLIKTSPAPAMLRHSREGSASWPAHGLGSHWVDESWILASPYAAPPLGRSFAVMAQVQVLHDVLQGGVRWRVTFFVCPNQGSLVRLEKSGKGGRVLHGSHLPARSEGELLRGPPQSPYFHPRQLPFEL